MVKKRPWIDPSPSYSYHAAAAGEDARARMRHQALLQDYQDLIKETDAKKKRILKAKQKKLKLFAEVKFLRRKLKSFLGDNSLEIPLKLKKESYRVAPPSPEYEQMDNSGLPSEAHLDDRNYKIAETATRGTSALSDLNQVSNRSTSPSMRYAQMFNSGLPSNNFSVDRNHKEIRAAARGTTALLDLNRASNRSTPPSMSNSQMHNLGLPPKAPTVDRNRKVTEGAIRGTSALSDLNQVSYRPAPPSSRYSRMNNSGLLPKAPQANRNHKETAALSDLNRVSYRVVPPSIRYAHNSGLPSKAHSVVGNHKLTQAAVPGNTILLDLNLDAEELEEHESLRIDNLKRFSVGGSTTMNDHKRLLCRVGGNERNQLPLRV